MESRFGDYCQRDYFKIFTKPINEPNNISYDVIGCDSIDYIIHAASLASPKYYDVCPVDVLSPNVLGTYHLLKLSAEKKIKGFLLFSTGDIYGVLTEKDFITENDMGIVEPLDIHSCYGESKRMAETKCYSFYHQYRVPVKIARIWHTYAPTMDIENDPRVYASFMKNIVNKQDIEIKSDGKGKRAFCYIADAVAAFFTILTKGKDGEAYNVCNTEQFISIKQLADIIAELSDNTKVVLKPRDKKEHYVENPYTGLNVPSNEKLKKLGWKAKYSVPEGFRRVFEHNMQLYSTHLRSSFYNVIKSE